MSYMVVSQTWLTEGDNHLEAYLALVARYEEFLVAQPGFVSRQLVRSTESPRHLIHLRTFETIEHYEAMSQIPEYQAQIEALSEHVDASAYPPGAVAREYGEVVFESSATRS
ncbi:MAG: antibiotic biosynthesis monooxygenase family protein [Acidimicrobiales bacterium]